MLSANIPPPNPRGQRNRPSLTLTVDNYWAEADKIPQRLLETLKERPAIDDPNRRVDTGIWWVKIISLRLKFNWVIDRFQHDPSISPTLPRLFLLAMSCANRLKRLVETEPKNDEEAEQKRKDIIADAALYIWFLSQTKEEREMEKSEEDVGGLEPLFDGLINEFCGHLDNRFMRGPEPTGFDFGEWIGFFSWDANGAASFSQRFGYMDKGYDYDNTISIADKALDYFAANPIMRIGPPNLANITRISLEHLISRLQGKDKNFNPKVPDFLNHFIESKKTNPDLVNDGIIMGHLLVNLLAGADTIAITIRAFFWYALHSPSVYSKLEKETLAAGIDNVASFSSARALPYLEACVREAMRMHPGVCMLLERYVPESGLKLPDGSFVPQGTAVGINPYVAGRNKDVYGSDSDSYRPERWLENEGETEEEFNKRMRLYNAADLTFGSGSRVCVSHYLAQLQLYKIIATLIHKYMISLVDPDTLWVVTGSWFPR
ncbi:cytochrome P450 monooxygenase [Fusarium napiforme]|uniref:Cytochrome P450 monooxygenase n=1 Tax=Fusarium napiforme TaxID=42672 RepID=A0A8H5IXB9_9HYPO|nr:cytochrome P450 monooxygenase [Fusarium napiforme]